MREVRCRPFEIERKREENCSDRFPTVRLNRQRNGFSIVDSLSQTSGKGGKLHKMEKSYHFPGSLFSRRFLENGVYFFVFVNFVRIRVFTGRDNSRRIHELCNKASDRGCRHGFGRSKTRVPSWHGPRGVYRVCFECGRSWYEFSPSPSHIEMPRQFPDFSCFFFTVPRVISFFTMLSIGNA